jgi:WD40 repeat protein/serine/threonine protein kinase
MDTSVDAGPGPDQDLRDWLAQAQPLEAAELVEILQRDQQRRWRRGERVPVEAYLRLCPGLAERGEEVLDLVLGEFLLRQERGEFPKLDEYRWRFPQLADPLQTDFELDEALAGDAAGTPDPQRETLRAGLLNDVSGPVVPGYEILAQLGRGGMGVVYKARHLALGRVVALKMLRSGPDAQPDDLARFRSEAEAAARLQHPNIVQIYEVGECKGQPYFAMEFVDGGSLAAGLDGTPWPAARAAALVETLARAAHAAHQCGIIHRDLKPANVLLQLDKETRRQGDKEKEPSSVSLSPCLPLSLSSAVPKLTDFGLAKRVEGDSSLTQTGVIVGTPSYMAPEQAAARKDLGPAVDVYALGAILYELITGRPPFRSETVMDTLLQVLHDDPVRPRRLQPKVPRDLETVCLKCLQKIPSQRYGSALDLADDLHRFREGESVSARPASTAERALKWARRRPAVAGLLAAVVGVSLVGLGLVLWQWRAAQRSAKEEFQARQGAERAREQAQFLLASSLLDQGAARGEQGDVGHCLLSLARGLEVASGAGAAELEHVARMSLALWSRQLVRERASLRHTDWVPAVGFSADGRIAVTGSGDRTAQLWDARTGAPLTGPLAHQYPVWTAALSRDGSMLVTGAGGLNGPAGEARLWNARTGKQVGVTLPFSTRVGTVAFAPDGKTFLTVSLEEAQLWSTADRRPIGPALVHRGKTPEQRAIVTGALSPDGTLVLTGGADGRARLWEAATGRLRANLRHQRPVVAVAFSPDGRAVLTGSEDGTAQLWETATGQGRGRPMRHRGRLKAVAFSPDSRLAATGGDVLEADDARGILRVVGGEARLWDVETGRPFAAALPHPEPVWSVAISRDGRFLLTGSEDGCARFFRAATGVLVGRPHYLYGTVRAVAFRPDGRVALTGVCGGEPVTAAHLWELPRDLERGGGWPLTDAKSQVLAFSPDGRFLAIAQEHAAQLWDVANGKPAGATLPHEGKVLVLAFSPDGRRLLSGSTGGKGRLWDLPAGKCLCEFPHPEHVRCVAFSADGTAVLTGGADHTARLWDAATGRPLGKPLQHKDAVDAVYFHPDGRTVLTTSWDKTIRRWERETGRLIHEVTVPSAPVVSRFSPDGRLVLTGTGSRAGRFFDVATGKPAGPTLPVRGRRVSSKAVSPDGRTAFLGDADGAGQLWDVATGKPLGLGLAHRDAIWTATFGPGGILAASDASGAVRLWDLPRPVAGTPEQARLWVEVLSGMELDSYGAVSRLDASALRERARQLEKLGGPPTSAPEGAGDGSKK